MKLTLIIKKGKSGFLIGQIEEIPSILTQGKTLAEVKENIRDAFKLFMENVKEESADEINEVEGIRSFASQTEGLEFWHDQREDIYQDYLVKGN